MFNLKNRIYYAKMKRKFKRGGVKPASTGADMDQYYDWLKLWSEIKVENIVEIGANYGQDAERLRYLFGLPREDIYVFEAHPLICKKAEMLFGFHSYNYAVFNAETKLTLHSVDENDDNTGISTIMSSKRFSSKLSKSHVVESIRMDSWMEKNHIDHIDFCKIDVEGATYEVLESFGDKLQLVYAIQLEAEHIKEYDEERLWPEIKEYLEDKGFAMVLFERHITQSDSLWIQNKYLRS